VNRDSLLQTAASDALSAADNQNFTQIVMVPLKKILQDPLKLVQCTGNETVFGLYNISLWNDLGFANTIENLLNGTSLPSFFPSNSSIDQGVQGLYGQEAQMENFTQQYGDQLNSNYNDMITFQNDLANASADNFCPPVPAPPPPCDTCCHIYNCQQSTQSILNSLETINQTLLPDLLNETSSFHDLLDRITKARRNIVDDLANSLVFPDLFGSIGSNIVDDLGQCAWLGNFWNSIVGDAICSKISPALLWVGWSFALVGITMFFLTPIIIWSLNLDSNIV
jgi:hypothetical protein